LSLLSRIRGWRRQQRRKRASKREKAPLREFVYLDEISVYSLIASRLGPVATEFTQTEASSLQGEAGGSIGAGVTGLGKGEVSARVAASQTHGSQVLRKSIVQTTFKELYELESDSLAMRPMSEKHGSPIMRGLSDLEAASETLAGDGWLIDPQSLARGRLLEIEVELEAEPIFRVSTVLSSFLEIFDENPELFGANAYDEFIQAKSIEPILAKLLVGLVPIRGRALDYEVTALGGKEWIIHRKLLEKLLATEGPPTHPLYLVGVAEQSLFWKDIRRILFSNARFRALCRMEQDGLQDSWSPIKLAQVLRSVAPDVADQINAVGSGALEAVSKITASAPIAEQKKRLMHDALVTYAHLLAEHYGHSVAPADLSDVGLPSEQHCSSYGNLKERREAFNAIAKFVLESYDLERDPLVIAQYRAVALGDAGLDRLGQPTALMSSDAPSPHPQPDERFLDSEFIAIYW